MPTADPTLTNLARALLLTWMNANRAGDEKLAQAALDAWGALSK
ncbi:hypothetical protein [Agromyces atrinae]|uniref:Uncharacterized protein n=1 Tax=Agromyces atrinae TaxID=592376 RepID=A0A852S113_9MICO|nr:hypothetical protein [Agromyces atrinae]NYD65992.1 hypothetical protein [Agromyces atrinae]